MACEICGESRYWDPSAGCLICNRQAKREKFVIVLTMDQWDTLRTMGHIEETLVHARGEITLIIQRAEDD